jgi:DNA-binding transcriptional regulator YdaS (Cro superfamily)
METREIIRALGGTSKVAKLCGISMPSVSQWKKNGIPSDKMIFLAAKLEKETEGKITRKQLFPDTWMDIWTELR